MKTTKGLSRIPSDTPARILSRIPSEISTGQKNHSGTTSEVLLEMSPEILLEIFWQNLSKNALWTQY